MASKRKQKDEKKETDKFKSINQQLAMSNQNYTYLVQQMMQKDQTIGHLNWKVMIEERYIEKLGGNEDGMVEIVEEWKKEQEELQKKKESTSGFVGADGKPLSDDKEIIV